ncbi:hypothetical protein ACFQ0O_41925 [Saccharopolyspora spinosporotrichia]
MATRRQLREMSLRPGGADPVALLRFRHRQPYRREELAELFRIELAKPKRTATLPARGDRAGTDRAAHVPDLPARPAGQALLPADLGRPVLGLLPARHRRGLTTSRTEPPTPSLQEKRASCPTLKTSPASCRRPTSRPAA